MDATTFLFIIRLLLTPILWIARNSCLHMAVVLLIVDLIDCKKLWYKLLWNETAVCTTELRYQILDKISDLFQYTIAIVLLSIHSTITKDFTRLLYTFVAWRAIGVVCFILEADTRYLVPFADVIKELLIVYAVFNQQYRIEAIIIACALKIAFEVWKNGTKQIYK